MHGCCNTEGKMHHQKNMCCGNRWFMTRDEKLEMLGEYKKSLENELKGVSERIEELKA